MATSLRLIGDIGGTNVRLALSGPAKKDVTRLTEYPCADFSEPVEVIQQFLSENQIACPEQVCIALAAIDDGSEMLTMTNLPWKFSSKELTQILGCQQLALLNDFEAVGLALPHLGKDQLKELREHKGSANKHRLAIGPGTGLGGCILTDTGTILPCEPGHAGLSPATDQEMELFRYFRRDVAEVYAEYLLCGNGLLRLYRGMAAISNMHSDLSSAEEITAAASDGDELAAATLLQFCDLLGSATGDFAATTGALGGIYLAGGMTPKLLDSLVASNFLERLNNKHAQRDNLSAAGVWAIREPRPGLLGCSHYTF